MDMRKRSGLASIIVLVAIAAMSFTAFGCSKGSTVSRSEKSLGSGESLGLLDSVGFSPEGGASFAMAPTTKMREAIKVEADTGKPSPAQSLASQASGKRKLIKTGNVNLESRDLDGAEGKIASMAKELGGYVAASSKSETYLSMSIRVPQDRFDAAMAGLKAAGRLKSRSESVEDVTLQYVDMESRIATKKILKERYTEYLKRAGKVEDLLSVERALNDVLSELDSMESSFKALRDQIDNSSLSVSVQLPPEAAPAAQRSFLGGLLAVWDGFLGFLYLVAYILAGIVLFGVPSILLLGLLYWLCFGKIGLVKKFFKLLSGKGRAV